MAKKDLATAKQVIRLADETVLALFEVSDNCNMMEYCRNVVKARPDGEIIWRISSSDDSTGLAGPYDLLFRPADNGVVMDAVDLELWPVAEDDVWAVRNGMHTYAIDIETGISSMVIMDKMVWECLSLGDSA